MSSTKIPIHTRRKLDLENLTLMTTDTEELLTDSSLGPQKRKDYIYKSDLRVERYCNEKLTLRLIVRDSRYEVVRTSIYNPYSSGRKTTERVLAFEIEEVDGNYLVNMCTEEDSEIIFVRNTPEKADEAIRKFFRRLQANPKHISKKELDESDNVYELL